MGAAGTSDRRWLANEERWSNRNLAPKFQDSGDGLSRPNFMHLRRPEASFAQCHVGMHLSFVQRDVQAVAIAATDGKEFRRNSNRIRKVVNK